MKTKGTNIQIEVIKQHSCVVLFVCLFFFSNILQGNLRLVVSNFVSRFGLVTLGTVPWVPELFLTRGGRK